MDRKEIGKTQKKLRVQLAIGVVMLIGVFFLNQYENQTPGPNYMTIYGVMLSAVFIIIPANTLRKIRKYLRQQDKN